MPDVNRPFADALQESTASFCNMLLSRLACGSSQEDPALEPQLLEAAAHRCAQEADLAATAGEPMAQAMAMFGQASALLGTDSLRAIRRAEELLLGALTLLETGAPHTARVEAYVLLCDLLTRVVDAVPDEQRDPFLERAIDLARAAEYVATVECNDFARARALGDEAVFFSRRFAGARDTNLMDAIDCGTRAFALLGCDNVRGAVRWPVLLLEMGNAAVGIETMRPNWIEQAQRFYNLGSSIVDAVHYPDLANILRRNCALWDTEDRHALDALPAKESFARLRYAVLRAEASRDLHAAIAAAEEMTVWACALPEQPNRFVGHAHLTLGRLLIAASKPAAAVAVLDSAMAVLNTFHADPKSHRLLREAIELRSRAAAAAPETSEPRASPAS